MRKDHVKRMRAKSKTNEREYERTNEKPEQKRKTSKEQKYVYGKDFFFKNGGELKKKRE